MISNSLWLTGAVILAPLAFVASALWCGYTEVDEKPVVFMIVVISTLCGVFWVITVPTLVLSLLVIALMAIGRRLRKEARNEIQ